jgi:hypothetical protein
LPTARFIPQRSIHARTRSIALTDVLLLLLRTAGILLLGAAVAGPVFATGARVERIVIADRSRAVGDPASVRDSVRAYLRAGDQLVAFDSAAHIASPAAVDSLAPTDARGSLSAALAAGTRSAVRAAARADSFEVVLISPLAEEELDAATVRLRATWPGRIRLVKVSAARANVVSPNFEVRAPMNDAVAAGLSLVAISASPPTVRVVRDHSTPEDTSWARMPGHVLVRWPASDSSANDWPPSPTIDAIGAVTAGGATLVARFPRLWSLQGGRTIARWADGEPAAVEHAMGAGCVRDVAVLIDESSDVTLHAPFRRFASELLSPCGGSRATQPVDSSVIAALAGTGALAPAAALRDNANDSSRWTPWLLAAAALILIGELAVRRAARAAA